MFLPALAPVYFPASAIDGSNTSALWLGFMGFLQSTLGAWFMLRNEAVPMAVRLMTLRLPTFKPAERAARGLVLRPLRGSYSGEQSNAGQRLAA